VAAGIQEEVSLRAGLPGGLALTGDSSMQRILSGSVGTLKICLCLAAVPWARAQQPVAMRMPAPELKGINEWINSKPLSLSDLKGKVVVVHFWTFG
jgi:hypothetical protein